MTINSPDEFAALVDEASYESRKRVREDNASLETWLQIIEKYPELKITAIWNKNVPIEILGRLSEDSETEVRAWVATKRKLTHPMFERLARDPSETVRANLVENAKTPSEVLEFLRNDPAPYVATMAKQKLDDRLKEAR